MRVAPLTLTKVATVVMIAMIAMVAGAGVASASQSGVATKRVDAERGGHLRMHNGVHLFIPPGVLRRDSRATITPLPGRRYDVHISGPWHGRVALSLPLKNGRDGVLHQVGGVWVAEGRRRGQGTVWVRQLSLFSTLLSGAAKTFCLSWDRKKIVACLISKGFKFVDKKLAVWLAKKISDSCYAALLVSVPFGAVSVALTVFNDPACLGHASAPAPPPGQKPTPQPGPKPGPPPGPDPDPGPGTPPPPPPPTWAEQQGSRGANTFTNPFNASGLGTKIQPYQWVSVSCKVYAPAIVSANPDGYWYRIASPPWSNAYYAVANTFWNGDIPGQLPYTHNTDWAVRDC